MRRAGKLDRNHPEIVRALRQAGVSVVSLAAVGEGCPDLLCGFRKQTFLLEVKDPMQPPSKRKLNPDQKDWHASWQGHAVVVETVAEAFKAVGI